uniref:C-type lectin domain-containing protein n=1 Tax=Stegastes partitus TaxID=144197 RepID=A0A3B5BEF4_9TELE
MCLCSCFTSVCGPFVFVSGVNSTFLSVLSPATVSCHVLASGQISSQYVLVQQPMSWIKAREFCRRHYVDLAVLSTEEHYFTLLNATAANRASYWLGLRRHSVLADWKWVDGEELCYQNWYRRNYEGCCASLEAMLKEDKKLLARYCKEQHMVACQGRRCFFVLISGLETDTSCTQIWQTIESV